MTAQQVTEDQSDWLWLICPACRREMAPNVSCSFDPDHNRIPWTGSQPCGYCNAPPGGLHHPICDIDECPYCHEQLLACACDT